MDRRQASAGHAVKAVVVFGCEGHCWLPPKYILRYRSPAVWRSPSRQNRARWRRPQTHCGKSAATNTGPKPKAQGSKSGAACNREQPGPQWCGGGRTSFRHEGKLPASAAACLHPRLHAVTACRAFGARRLKLSMAKNCAAPKQSIATSMPWRFARRVHVAGSLLERGKGGCGSPSGLLSAQ
jgi:hypothetical protein